MFEKLLILIYLFQQSYGECHVFNNNIRSHSTHVKCSENIQAQFTGDIQVLEIYNSSFSWLSEDHLNRMPNITKLIVSESSLLTLNIPFAKLESFEAYDSLFAWDFSALTPLSQLQRIVIENSEILPLPDSFHWWPYLRFVQVIGSKIQMISEDLLAKNERLVIFSISKNFIKTISRSMFPQPAKYLWSIDLSYNKIQSLPRDAFEEMYSLKELKLDNNQLNVNGDVYAVVWKNLTQLWLNGNNMICWKLCPIVNGQVKEERPEFFDSSKCVLPSKGKILVESFDC